MVSFDLRQIRKKNYETKLPFNFMFIYLISNSFK